jgi:mannose-6-phosphate isomerase-like protein (cupin superfamily)
MARGTLIRPSDVKPFLVSDAYVSRMLLDHTNSESQKVHVNHGTLAPGGTLLPASAHGTDQDHYDETYFIIKGKCKLELDGEVLMVQAGDVIFIPGGVTHGLDNSEGMEEVELLTIWAGVPPQGINGVYDARVERWGKSYRTVDED